MVKAGVMQALSVAMIGLAAVLVLVTVAFVGTNSGVHSTVLAGVSRISIFDQWSEPAEAAGQNPSIVRFGMKDMERTRDKCIAKCQDRPGYNPSKADVEICERFCHRVADDVTPFDAQPQPAQHSWWSRVSPDGQEYRYLQNEKASAGFDPAARPKLKPVHSHKTILAKHSAHRQAAAASAGKKEAGVSMLLQTAAGTESGHGLDTVTYTHKDALSEMADYFDSLPTKDCAHPDCNYEDKVVKMKKVLVKKGQKFTTKDIKHYERAVLGYHRRHEKALENGELQKIGEESNRMMSNSINGYNRLEAEAKARNPHAKRMPNVGQHPRARHSTAYLKAKQAPGFQGYSYNVFAERENQQPVEEVVSGQAGSSAGRGSRGADAETAELRAKEAEHDQRLHADETALRQMQGKVQALEAANKQLQDVSSALSKVVLASKQQAADGPQGGGGGAAAESGAAEEGAAGAEERRARGGGVAGARGGGKGVGALERRVLQRTEGTLQEQLEVLRAHLTRAQAEEAEGGAGAGRRGRSAGREAAVRELRAADDALLKRKLEALTQKAKREQGELLDVLGEHAPTGGDVKDAEAKQLLGYSPRKVRHLESSEWSQIKRESSF